MKSTKKLSKMLLAGMSVMALAFGLVLTGCPADDDVKLVTVDPSTLSPNQSARTDNGAFWQWNSVDKRIELEAYLTGLGFTVSYSTTNALTNPGHTEWVPYSRIEYRTNEPTRIEVGYVDGPNSEAHWKRFTHPNFEVVLPEE